MPRRAHRIEIDSTHIQALDLPQETLEFLSQGTLRSPDLLGVTLETTSGSFLTLDEFCRRGRPRICRP